MFSMSALKDLKNCYSLSYWMTVPKLWGCVAMHDSKWWFGGASGRNCYSSCLEERRNKMKHHTPLIIVDNCSKFIFWKVGVSLQSRTKITAFNRSICLKTAVCERGGGWGVNHLVFVSVWYSLPFQIACFQANDWAHNYWKCCSSEMFGRNQQYSALSHMNIQRLSKD